MGDVDFANDFTEELMKVLIQLKELSAATAEDCINRKHEIDAIFSNDSLFDKQEEEVIELADKSVGAELNDEYNTVSEGCSNYFEAVSSDVNTVTSGYVDLIIKKLTAKDTKDMLLLKEKDLYTALKIQLFNVLDTATDV
jgi:hypothetical protein